MATSVKVILREDIENLGKEGDVVSVLEGYARNFLIPQSKAYVANTASLNELAQRKAAVEKIRKEELEKAQSVKNLIDGKSVDVFAKGGNKGKLFGSVTSKDISEALNAKYGVFIEKKKIKSSLEETKIIDTFGSYPYEIKIYTGVTANITVNVKEQDVSSN